MLGDDDEELLVQVIAYFEARGWPISRHDTLPVVRMEFAADNAEGTMFVQITPGRRRVVAYAALPDRVPPERRADVGELLIRANGALSIGNFDLDLDEGEIRFRSGLDLGATVLTDDLIDPLVQSCLVSVGDVAPAIAEVIAGRRRPEEAINEVWRGAADVDLDLR